MCLFHIRLIRKYTNNNPSFEQEAPLRCLRPLLVVLKQLHRIQDTSTQKDALTLLSVLLQEKSGVPPVEWPREAWSSVPSPVAFMQGDDPVLLSTFFVLYILAIISFLMLFLSICLYNITLSYY